MKKIYTKNNYLIIEFAGSVPLMRPKKNIFFFRTNDDPNKYIIKDSLQPVHNELEIVSWDEFIKENETPFSSIIEFNDWITQNTGNFNQGSSGGAYDPSNYDLAEFKNISVDPFTQESDLSDYTKLSDFQAISTIIVTNSGASLGALNANTTVDLNLNTSSTWVVNALASKTGANVAEIINPTTGMIKDVADKNLNTIRVVIEYSHSGGGSDGILNAQLVNPSGVVIDQESEPVNINGSTETNTRAAFRFFVVKTSDNNLGYTLRISNGAKSLTSYRIVSVLRNNNK